MVAFAFPLVVLAVPILDSGFVVAKRLKYRQPIYQADRSHFHHRMANIGFSQRRTLAYLYGWTLILAALALALRFVPYSDNHGHFNAGWTAVMIVCGLLALAASIYLVYVLEILKLRRVGGGSCAASAARRVAPSPTPRRSTAASPKSSRQGAFPQWTRKPASSSCPVPSRPSGHPAGVAERAAGSPVRL